MKDPSPEIFSAIDLTRSTLWIWHLICLITLEDAVDLRRHRRQSGLGIVVREATPGCCSLTVPYVPYDLCMIVASKGQNWVGRFPAQIKFPPSSGATDAECSH
jgi:hypothetical protein